MYQITYVNVLIEIDCQTLHLFNQSRYDLIMFTKPCINLSNHNQFDTCTNILTRLNW